MLTLSHGLHGHGYMGLPVGADVNEVDVVALAELFPALASGVGGSAWQAFLFKDIGLHGFHTVSYADIQFDNGKLIIDYEFK